MTIDQKIEQLKLEMDVAEKSLIKNLSALNPVQTLLSSASTNSTLPKLGIVDSDKMRTLASLLPLSLLSKYGRYFLLVQKMYRMIK